MVSIVTGRIEEKSVTNFGTSTRSAVRPSTGPLLIQLLRVSIKRTAGTAASFTPRIYDESAGVSGSINQRYLGSATAVADLFDVVAEGAYLQTDTDGYFYLEPGPNAGADNAFDYSIIYRVI
jgi:hypothetical protein